MKDTTEGLDGQVDRECVHVCAYVMEKKREKAERKARGTKHGEIKTKAKNS